MTFLFIGIEINLIIKKKGIDSCSRVRNGFRVLEVQVKVFIVGYESKLIAPVAKTYRVFVTDYFIYISFGLADGLCRDATDTNIQQVAGVAIIYIFPVIKKTEKVIRSI